MPPGKSVLLIDDSRTFLDLMERALRRHRQGTQVYPMVSGEDALEHLILCGTSRPMPGIVLLDRTMPGGMNGFETLARIRQEAHLQELPVLIVSGSDMEEHLALAREVGADEYLVKGGDLTSLALIAKRALEWSASESWRTSGERMAEQILAVREVRVPSGSMTSHAPTVIQSPTAHDENTFLRAFHAVREFVVKSFDPVDYAINEACRKHGIPVSHARGRGGDYITVQNRHRVILDLMNTGVGDRVILENFQVSQRAMERLRSEWRANGGGSLADRSI